MMKEEDYIISRYGKKRPFSVPEGYFDSFAQQFMEQLPEREPSARVVEMKPRARWNKLPRWVAAACFVVALAGVGTWAFHATSSQGSNSANAMPMANSSYNVTIDQMADYTMIDNGDIYAYVSDN